MAGSPLRIVSVADALQEVMPAVETQLRSDGVFCDRDQAVMAGLRDVTRQIEEDAGVVTYALSLFRADARSRRSQERRRDLEQTFGPLPPAPWGDEAA